MIRFLHAADAHIDSPLKGIEAHAGSPAEILRGATRRAFENLIQLAVDEQVDFLVLSGDIYDGDWRDYGTGLFFRAQMARLNDRDIPVYLISGNHDAASVISRKLSLPQNVHVFSTRTVESVEVPGHPVLIHGRGFPNRAVPENLALDYPPAVKGKFNLGLLHTSLTGRAGYDTYAPCSEADLHRKGYGYWALGHIHQPEVIHRDPWIVFSGNCQGRDAREAGPRGCWLVTVNDFLEVERVDWHSLDVVRWQVLRVDLTEAAEESEMLAHVSKAMSTAVKEAEGRLLAARIVLVGATPLHGWLHRGKHGVHAELLGRAQDFGDGMIWIERLDISTSPVYDLEQLAQRDALTGTVLKTLEEARMDLGELPGEVKEMLNALPPELLAEVESEWSENERVRTLEDVRAIILDALGTAGAHAS